jgi:hypothetical protein
MKSSYAYIYDLYLFSVYKNKVHSLIVKHKIEQNLEIVILNSIDPLTAQNLNLQFRNHQGLR